MYILGISAFYHDSAAALIKDGKIIAAAQEERFTRKKHDAGYPQNAIAYCLEEASISVSDIDYVAFYDKPFLKFERLLETYVAFAPRGFQSFRKALPIWIKEKLFQKNLLKKQLQTIDNSFNWKEKLLFTEHHQSHAASAFYPSPFDNALVLTMDGVGEWATTSLAIGQGNDLKIVKELHFPHSIGLLYSAFTYYTGFKVNSGEYKLMGLAPYGEPKYYKTILDHLLDLKPDGTFRLNQDYFNYCVGLTMTNKKFDALFGRAARKPDEEDIEQFHMDIAASIQQVTEEIVLRMTRVISKDYSISNLCLAGGVALNCVANGKILRDGHFKNIWIQPAAGDAGGALGAALSAYYYFLDQARIKPEENIDAMRGALLGPSFTDNDIEDRMQKVGAVYQRLSRQDMLKNTARALSEDKVVGWFQGRMEFGPRALGGRSILGNPCSPEMQRVLNLKIKFRESFRPFAPSVLAEEASDWFELDAESPYMLMTAPVKTMRRNEETDDEKNRFGIDRLQNVRSSIPAVTHVDYSARIQTVDQKRNPLYHSLISEFKKITECPVVVNTSFNIRGEPIVCTPEDAFRCFMGTEMDVLVIENCILKKEDQKNSLKLDYKNKFQLD